MVSPLTAGGIFTALDFGARAAEAVADHLAGTAPDPALALRECARVLTPEGALCFTLGRWTTATDVEAVLQRLPPIVSRLRALAPLHT